MIEYQNLAQLNAPYERVFRKKFAHILGAGRYLFGPENDAFEQEFASYCGVNYCRAVGSGTDALILGFQALKLTQGAEVVVASNVYIACIMAIINAGLKPVLAEPDPDTYLLTAEGIRAVLTPRTEAILAVHLYGRAAAMDEIMDLARKNALAVVEDCAQAHGAEWAGRKVGSWGDAAAFSFFPTKNLGALGDGGAITTKDEAVANRISQLRFYGFDQRHHSKSIGRVSRLDEIQAGFLRIKLAHLDGINEHKKRLASRYRQALPVGLKLPLNDSSNDRANVYHIFPIMTGRRDQLKSHLERQGVQTLIHYPVPPARQASLAPWFNPSLFPVADHLAAHELSLPISTIHDEKTVERVCAAFSSF